MITFARARGITQGSGKMEPPRKNLCKWCVFIRHSQYNESAIQATTRLYPLSMYMIATRLLYLVQMRPKTARATR